MKVRKLFTGLFTLAVSALIGPVAQAANDVIITPLGAQQGEFCRNDRAVLFEDPSGVRILIQPGRTVNGAGDLRLGVVHAILLDHAHDDHSGEVINLACDGNANANMTLANPAIPNIAAIAIEKNSAILVGGELVPWLRNRIGNPGGCGASGLTSLTEVVRTSPCADTLRPGASRELQLDGVPTGVHVSTVQATHSNGISPQFLDGVLPAGTNAYGGTETGYVIRFSNGLSVYWSGDSGMFGDMKLFSEFYNVNMALIHMGDVFTMNHESAAFAVNNLIKPRTVIPHHANEVATIGGEVQTGTRTEAFINLIKRRTDVIVPLSDVKIRCNGNGRCRQDKSPNQP